MRNAKRFQIHTAVHACTAHRDERKPVAYLHHDVPSPTPAEADVQVQVSGEKSREKHHTVLEGDVSAPNIHGVRAPAAYTLNGL